MESELKPVIVPQPSTETPTTPMIIPIDIDPANIVTAICGLVAGVRAGANRLNII